MELALVGGQYKRIEECLSKIQDEQCKVTILKVEKPIIYFCVNTMMSVEKCIQYLNKELRKNKYIRICDFQIYGFYNGKIDYASYLSDAKKDQLGYYK